jgi:glycosyltransferase 2 family protein
MPAPPDARGQAGSAAPADEPQQAAGPQQAAAGPGQAAGPQQAAAGPGQAAGPQQAAAGPGQAAGPQQAAAGPGQGAAGPGQAAAETPGRGGSLESWLAWLLRVMRSPAVRYAFLAVVLALLAVALVDQGSALWHQVQRLSAPVALLALALNFCGLVCSMMVWRELLADLGSRLSVAEAWRNFFIGQLGKYIPGSLWPMLAQAELGADRGIPRSRSALSVLLSYAVMSSSGAIVAAVTLPFATAGTVAQYSWVLILVPVGIMLLSPPVLNRVLRLVLRVARQPPLPQGVSFRGLARTMVWAVSGWALNGLEVYVLMRHLAGDRQGTLLVSVGAYALSWVAGFVAVFAPAGAGVRDAVMLAVLHTRTTTAIALTVALVARATAVLCDALTGAAAAALVGRRRRLKDRAVTGPELDGSEAGPG